MRSLKRLLAVLAFTSLTLPAWCQSTLAPGQSLTFQFNNMVSAGFYDPIYAGRTWLFFNPDISFLGLPGVVRLEAFENSTTEAPLVDTTLFQSPFYLGANAWNDLQGVIRITALTETVQVGQVAAIVVKDDRSRFEQFAMVPEPQVLGLFAAALGGLLVVKRK